MPIKYFYLDCEILQRCIIKLLLLIQFLFGLGSPKLTKETLNYVFQLHPKPVVSKKKKKLFLTRRPALGSAMLV